MTQLPLLFLPDVVILPGMVVPIELDEAAQAAVDAARATESHELLVAPRLDDRYASYGVVATIEKVGRFSRGGPAAVLRAGLRAEIGSGVTGPGAALWVEATPVEPSEPTEHARELASEYQKLVVAVLQRREAWQIIDQFGSLTDPEQIADTAGWAPYLNNERKRDLLETPDVERRLELLTEWTREHLAEVEINDKIGTDVREGMEKSQREFLLRQQLNAIRKELGEGEPDGADDYRARVEAAEVPDEVRAALLREVDKLERSSDQSPEVAWIRTWLDTVLELPVEHHDRRLHRRRRGTRRARRRPPRAGRREGPDRRVPRRPRPTGLAWPRRRRRTRQRCRDPARGPSRRRQDVARRVRRAHARPEVRARRPRRRAGRGGDPRPPAHVRRCAAGPHRPRDQGGRLDEPGRAAGRGRQGRLGLPGRPGGGAARGARPGAEPHVPRPLPRARPGPVRRPVHRHRQRGGDHPAGTARPDGAGDARRLHRGRQGRHRPRLPGAQAARAGGAGRRGGDRDRRGAA